MILDTVRVLLSYNSRKYLPIQANNQCRVIYSQRILPHEKLGRTVGY